ncbi:MerR family DNA-binding protein [Marinobacterium rhizophilum]|uniref:MerR family DNA-binding protein n=1 Tax=Marinobacterium rhizophilum TaxID=420402 RepID=A0ABY5HF31_9GAMM|nr:MerR family DNA-binding protein [Marinobacterium rhizophilum]UTW10734.1 MerR family DNA-binding protein [Marinobacterium rhizophilum]
MAQGYSIGKLSAVSGVNLETVRYYERIGLLPAPQRAANGYRCYTDAAARRLRFIRRGRELGFGIEAIRTLLQLADHPELPCGEADQLTLVHLRDVEARIADLEAMRQELIRLSGCDSDRAEHCRLIEALDRDGG